MNLKSIELDNIINNFTILAPFKGADKIVIYNEKKEALKMFSLYSLGEYNEDYSPSLIKLIFTNSSITEKINVVESENENFDLYSTKLRKAKLKFIWQGECTYHQRNKIQEQFSKYSDDIYKFILENNHYNTSESINNIEDEISIISYQAMKFSMENKNRKKMRIRRLSIILIIYLILLGVIVFMPIYKYILF